MTIDFHISIVVRTLQQLCYFVLLTAFSFTLLLDKIIILVTAQNYINSY